MVFIEEYNYEQKKFDSICKEDMFKYKEEYCMKVSNSSAYNFAKHKVVPIKGSTEIDFIPKVIALRA